MGDEAEDTLVSTNVSEDDRKDYSRVIAKFNVFFKVQKTLFLRELDLTAAVREKAVEQFITSLYNLAENCKYREMKGEIRIVMGIRD